MLSSSNRALLFHSHYEPAAKIPPQWIFPGGGIELGETRIECVLRELREETGRNFAAEDISDLDLCVLANTAWFDGRYQTDQAHFYTLRTEEFDPDSAMWTADEQRDTIEFRWWSAGEIRREAPPIGPESSVQTLLRILES